MSEYDKYKKDRQRLIEATKVKMSTPDGGAGVSKEDYKPLKPTTFKGKWENYWYHYKWHTFASIFGSILIVMFAWQMIFKTVYDAKFTIVSEYQFDNLVEPFKKNVSDLVTDYTKNGKIDIDITFLQQDYDGKNNMPPEMIQANFVKLSAGLSELDGFIYMLDKASYDNFKEMEVTFMDLSKLADTERLDKPDRYNIKGTKLAEKLDIGDLTKDIYLCFIDYDSFDQKRQNKKSVKATYERDIMFFNKMLAYK